MVTMVFMVSIRGTARGDISLIYYCGFYGFYFPPRLISTATAGGSPRLRR
jgi:hypothetical protein